MCDLKNKAKIIDILGEEMFNVCLENPAKATAFSWLFSFSIAEFDKANGLDSGISEQLLNIREELGEELCIWCSKNYNGLVNLTSILSSYIDAYENTQKIRNNLKQLIEGADSNNYGARIAPLISAFEAKDGTNSLLELFDRAQINCVQDLWQLLTLTIDEKDNVELIRFITWLREDKLATLINELHNLFKKTRDEEIIRKRANGATFKATSRAYGLTYEGVRQIERKFQVRFDSYILRIMPHYILYAFGKNSSFISGAEIKELLDDLSDIFTYCLKVSNCPTAHWSEQLNGFIIGDGKWYEQLNECKKGLPQIIDYDSIDDIIAAMITNLALPLVFDDTKRLVLVDYILSEKVYLKKRMNLSQMYCAVLEKYYPAGIKLYDKSEIIRFRNYLRELFGEVYLPKYNRAIEKRLTDLTILCDRGKRILPSGIKISIASLRKIHTAIIEFEGNEIMYIELFERFKNELLANNITNQYFLQGVLRQNYSNEFIFTRYSLRRRW